MRFALVIINVMMVTQVERDTKKKRHWSFYPTGQKMTQDMVHLMTYGDIPEFSGCEHAEEMDVIQHYILGIGSVPNPVVETIQDSTLTE